MKEKINHLTFKRWDTLYPTWFRWKGSRGKRWSAEVKYFISHMVQMKDRRNLITTNIIITLYPTWFRWKSSWCYLCTCVYCLYIPHGSDESLCVMLMKSQMAIFISHMVQMKALCFFFSKATTSLYIPHGSDESSILNSVKNLFWSLYPTWFRWKSNMSIPK